jgi:hypothetical protein
VTGTLRFPSIAKSDIDMKSKLIKSNFIVFAGAPKTLTLVSFWLEKRAGLHVLTGVQITDSTYSCTQASE